MVDAAVGIAFLFGLALFALWIFVCYWVYNDAQRRGSNHALAWAIGVFAIGLVGLVLYLVVRGDMDGKGGGQTTY